MKKTVAILTLFIICSMIFCGWWFRSTEEYYAKSGVVTFVDRTEDRVCFTDNQGEIWEFESSDDWEVDDLVACVMNDNGTDEIFDDIVISVKYEG